MASSLLKILLIFKWDIGRPDLTWNNARKVFQSKRNWGWKWKLVRSNKWLTHHVLWYYMKSTMWRASVELMCCYTAASNAERLQCGACELDPRNAQQSRGEASVSQPRPAWSLHQTKHCSLSGGDTHQVSHYYKGLCGVNIAFSALALLVWRQEEHLVATAICWRFSEDLRIKSQSPSIY